MEKIVPADELTQADLDAIAGGHHCGHCHKDQGSSNDAPSHSSW
jgi:hypothetical protein